MTHLAIPVIESRGLRLRQPVDRDLDDIVTACNDPDIQSYLAGIPIPYTLADAADWVARSAADKAGGTSLVIADAVSDHLLGTVGLSELRARDASFEIGYWVAPWARRRNVASNSLLAVAEWAFANKINRMELIHRLDNEASMRVAMATGFTHEGVKRAGTRLRDGSYADVALWSRLASDSGEPNLPELPDLPYGHLSDGVVTLVPLGPEDVDDYFAIAQLPEVVATTVVSAPLTRERIARRCVEARYHWLLGARAQFTIRDANSGAFAGLIAMMSEGFTKQAMLGYDVAREFRRRGYATRAVQLVATWAFEVVGTERLVAGTAPDNEASQRVLVKAGFQREGFERGRLPRSDGAGRVDNISWAMLPGDL
jgi:RimJ/RimL family protein N-acetyltransferase